MSKKVLAIVLAAVVAACMFSACKSAKGGESGKDTGTSSASAVSGEASTAEGGASDTTAKKGEAASGKEAQGKDAENSGESASAKESGASDSGKQTTTAKGTSKTDGWKKKENGSVVKGDVRANVAKYGKSDLAEGEELIKQLVEAGLKDAEKLGSKKTDNTIIYTFSGKRIGSDTTEYVKFEYIVQKGRGYLVTVIAANEADMNTDISYILNNLAALAK